MKTAYRHHDLKIENTMKSPSRLVTTAHQPAIGGSNPEATESKLLRIQGE